MDLTAINRAGRMEFLPTKTLADVEKNVDLRITSLKRVSTKFGPSIVVEVDNTFSTFLPRRIVKVLSEEGSDSFDKMVHASNEGTLYMKLHGGRFNTIEFQPDLATVNEAGRVESAFLPTKKLSEVPKDRNLCITAMRKVATKFGPRITVDVDNTYSVFLPARIVSYLIDDREDSLSRMIQACTENRLYMHYLGGAYNNVTFVYV